VFLFAANALETLFGVKGDWLQGMWLRWLCELGRCVGDREEGLVCKACLAPEFCFQVYIALYEKLCIICLNYDRRLRK